MCLVSIGRQKFTEGLNLPDFNIELERGSIKINHITMETSCLGVYAIGRLYRDFNVSSLRQLSRRYRGRKCP